MGPGSRVLALLMADVGSSATRWESAPEDNDAAMRRLDAVVERSLADGGRLVKPRGEGDNYFAVFPDVAAAVRMATRLQATISDERWSCDSGLARPELRVAIHHGEVEERDGDYFGPAVNRVARLRAAAWPGQVVLTDAARRRLGGSDASSASSASLIDLGVHRLRDLIRPERVHQLVCEGAPSTFPPLASDPQIPPISLPLDSLVGRDDDVDQVLTLLQEAPVVALWGEAGTGKSRLAMEAAARYADDRHGTIGLVSLATVQPGAAGPAIRAAAQRLVEYAVGRHPLLVVDDCDPLLAECAEAVSDVRQRDPQVHILATRRSPPRRAAGFEVMPLRSADAVQLLADRASAAGATVDPTDPVASEICALVEHLPLAIELAASRVTTLGLVGLRDRLLRSDRVLSAARRSGPPHHRSMDLARSWGGP